MAKKKAEEVTVEGAQSSATEAQAPDEKKMPLYKVGPIATARYESVSVAVWANEVQKDGEKWTLFNVVAQASYRDAEGTWKASKGFRGTQLPVLIYCLQRAYDFVLSQRDPANDCPF